MDVTYTVHRTSTHPVEVVAEYEGQKAKVHLPELEVEMTCADRRHGSLTLHFRTAEEIARAKDLFIPGEQVVASFSTSHAPASVDTTAETPAP